MLLLVDRVEQLGYKLLDLRYWLLMDLRSVVGVVKEYRVDMMLNEYSKRRVLSLLMEPMTTMLAWLGVMCSLRMVSRQRIEHSFLSMSSLLWIGLMFEGCVLLGGELAWIVEDHCMRHYHQYPHYLH